MSFPIKGRLKVKHRTLNLNHLLVWGQLNELSAFSGYAYIHLPAKNRHDNIIFTVTESRKVPHNQYVCSGGFARNESTGMRIKINWSASHSTHKIMCTLPHLMPMWWSLRLLDRRRETVDTELSVCSASINSSCCRLIAAVGDNGHDKWSAFEYGSVFNTSPRDFTVVPSLACVRILILRLPTSAASRPGFDKLYPDGRRDNAIRASSPPRNWGWWATHGKCI